MVGYQVLEERELERPLTLCRDLLRRGPAAQALAGELLALIGAERAGRYDETLLRPGDLWEQARDVLLTLATEGAAPEQSALLRCRAGVALGGIAYGPVEGLARGQAPQIPDPRLLDSSAGEAPDGRYWCAIEPGPFWYGDDQKGELQQMALEQGFKLARYPVTNAEFAAFVAAGGYQCEAWWTPEGWLTQQRERWEAPRYWEDLEVNSPLQPVVGISWYEAAAYCSWLTAEGQRCGWLAEQEVIRLPSAPEWERAARGDDRRRYPWGDEEPSPERANYDATRLQRTSPVGCFPRGVAPCGALDMAGNTFEWTLSKYEEESAGAQKDFTMNDTVSLPGGAWAAPIEYLCCGSRGWDFPYGGGNDRGFRVVWSLRAH